MIEGAKEKIVIVGAGPAGIRAAETLVAAGLKPIVIDEGLKAGGQIYRRPPEGFKRSPETLYGSEAGKARALHALFDTLVASDKISYHPQSSVLALADKTLHVQTPEGRREFPYDRLILATGATDRLAPVPGWHSAGVYTLGATQIALKAQGLALGREIVLAGSGPLLTLVASQLIKAGANVAAVLDTSSLSAQIKAMPGMMMRPVLVLRGFMMRLRLGRRYHAGVHLDRINSGERGPESIDWRDTRGKTQTTQCDMVGLGWHLRAETQLAGLAECGFEYDAGWAQWLPKADRMGRVRDGLYIAGDGLRILGADGADIAGRLAAKACLGDMGLRVTNVSQDLRKYRRYERFARALSRAFRWPNEMVHSLPDETIVCRCENITAGELRETASYGGPEANRVKSLGRVGMGRCQGRYCQIAGAELIAQKARITPCEVGRLREQAPVRPVTIGDWIKKAD